MKPTPTVKCSKNALTNTQRQKNGQTAHVNSVGRWGNRYAGPKTTTCASVVRALGVYSRQSGCLKPAIQRMTFSQKKPLEPVSPRGLDSPTGSRDYSEYIMYCSIKMMSESAFLATRNVENATRPSPEVKLTSNGLAFRLKTLMPSR